MKSVDVRCLMVFILSILSFSSYSGSKSEYGDIIKGTPEYEKITKPKYIDDDNDRHEHHYHYHHSYYRHAYPPSSTHYRSTGSGRSGLTGTFYLGVTVGES